MRLSRFRSAAVLAAVFLSAAPLTWADKLVIYHTSDIHGYYFTRPDKSGEPFGGFAVFENLLRQEKEPFVLLDSGDFSSGNRESNLSDGRYSVELMNAAGKSARNVHGRGYAALTIGNHDSDFGPQTLGRTLDGFNGDILSANMTGLPLSGQTAQAFRMYNWNGKKIAVIGYSLDGPGIGTELAILPLTRKQWHNLLDRVAEQTPDAVILLAHDSIADSRKPSQSLDSWAPELSQKRKIDVFLGGHAHALNTERRLGEQGPLFVESGSMLEGASRIVLDFDEQTGKLQNISAEYIRLDAKKWGENRETLKRLNEIEDISLRQEYAQVPATLFKFPRGEDAAPDVAKLLADYMKRWLEPQERVDFAFFQLPGVRRDLNPGPLTGRDLAELLPYTEYVSTFDIPGKKFKQAAEASLKCPADAHPYSLFSYSDNVYIEFVCRPHKKRPAKITKLLVNGKKISGRKIYRAAAIAHIPDGYFEGVPFKGYKNPRKKIYKKTSGELLFDIVENLPGATAEDKQLTAPGDIRIRQK